MVTMRAEESVIGCLLLDANRVLEIANSNGITRESFENPVLSEIWGTACDMYSRGVPVDLISIDGTIRRSNPKLVSFIGELHWNSFLQGIVDKTPTVEHAAYYVEELTKEVLKRNAKRISSELSATVDAHDDPSLLVSSAAKDLLDIAATKTAKNKRDVQEAISTRWSMASKGECSGISLPWPNVNRRIGGAQPGVVMLLTGRGGKGKSSAIATWATALGDSGTHVGWMPFEDGCERTYGRSAAILGEFSSFKLDTGASTPEELDEANYHLGRVFGMPIFMEDRHMYVEQIFSWTMRNVASNRIEILFIDAWKDILRRKHDLAEDEFISRTICELARRARIPIVVNHHVRKDGTDTRNERLTEADIRGTGQIANDARQIIIVQNEVNADGTERFEFDIAKNSYGPTGTFPMLRISKWNKWIEPEQFTVPAGRNIGSSQNI